MAVYTFAALRFDASDGCLEKIGGDDQVRLRPQVARLLAAFLERPQKLLDREDLRRLIWEEGTVIDFESGLAALLRELRAELKALGAPADLIETLPRRGYRLCATVERHDARVGWSAAGRKRLFGLTLALVLILIVILNLPDGDDPSPPGAEEWTLAVLPFSQFGQPVQGARRLDLLLADRLLVHLWDQRPAGVNLVGRASLAPYADGEEIATVVARDLGVNLLLEGSVVIDDAAMSVAARLLEMPAGRIVWSDVRHYPADELPSADEIAADLAASLVSDWSARMP